MGADYLSKEQSDFYAQNGYLRTSSMQPAPTSVASRRGMRNS